MTRRETSEYALLTSAYNEERYIGRTIEAVLAQNVQPVRWVIVSDGSSDGTDDVVRTYQAKTDVILFERLERSNLRGVASKVRALRHAYKMLGGLEFDFVGNLDADVSFDPDYYERLLTRFQREPDLGATSGLIHEDGGRGFRARWSNSLTSVGHAAQLMRRECYEKIGGYLALEYGGEDWYAEIRARMNGWRVAPTDLPVRHYRPTGAADRILRHCFRQGRMDFSMGSHPLFEVVKCLRRVPERPVLVRAAARYAGFCWACAADPLLVSKDVAAFVRKEQKGRLKAMFQSLKRCL